MLLRSTKTAVSVQIAVYIFDKLYAFKLKQLNKLLKRIFV